MGEKRVGEEVGRLFNTFLLLLFSFRGEGCIIGTCLFAKESLQIGHVRSATFTVQKVFLLFEVDDLRIGIFCTNNENKNTHTYMHENQGQRANRPEKA